MVDWLQTHALSNYAATFARLKLDSLHKISKMTSEQIATVSDEAEEDELGAKSVTGHAQTFPMGMRIVLSQAVASLQSDERAQTLTQRLENYTDLGMYALVNVIWRKNQVQLVLGSAVVRGLVILLMLVAGILCGTLVWLDNLRDPWFNVASVGRVTSYQVQSSLNGSLWQTVGVFNSSAGRPEDVVTSRFLHYVDARYI